MIAAGCGPAGARPGFSGIFGTRCSSPSWRNQDQACAARGCCPPVAAFPRPWGDGAGAGALVFAALSWSIAAALSRKLPTPEDKVTSSGAQMLVGGVLLITTATLLGELDGFQVGAVSRDAWLALAYLVVAASIVAFTAYVWLLHHESPTRVGTYAYVNPVVAVLIGYFLGGETLGARTLAGTVLVLVSVVVIMTTPAKQRSG
jgi:drug/metabolite transporter (DMT)-like permease